MRTIQLLALTGLLATCPAAQDSPLPLAYRDGSAVHRLRVVCAQKHYGRIDDLVVAVPSGRIVAAVVAMRTDGEVRRVVVPWSRLGYVATTNLLQLGDCPESDGTLPAFDPTKIGVARRPHDDGTPGEVEGTALLSALGDRVALRDGNASLCGVTLELTSGHVAFLDLSTVKGEVGDGERHPVPWGALAFDLDEASAPRLRLRLDETRAVLEAAPTLLEVVVEDPLYRRQLYTLHEVVRPEYDVEV